MTGHSAERAGIMSFNVIRQGTTVQSCLVHVLSAHVLSAHVLSAHVLSALSAE